MTEKSRFNTYILLSTSLIVVTAIAIFLTPFIGKTNIYLLFLITVVLNALYSGKNIALVSVIWLSITSALYFFFYHQPQIQFSFMVLLEILLFIIVSVMVTIVLDSIKNTTEMKTLRKQEKVLQERVFKQEQEIMQIKAEIQKRDEFLSIASHELKTPLTSMLLKIQLILHNIKNVSLAKFSVENLLNQLTTAEHQTQRLSRMINDLLNVSLITTGKLHLEPEALDLTKLVKDVIDEFSERLEKGNIQLTLHADGPIPATLDKLRIEQVVTNLLSNAIKYGNGKPIEVTVKRKNNHAVIIVQDHGIGIPAHQQKNIFSLFDRGDVNSNYKGLGVGLFITNQIVTSHHGSVIVESEKDNGSTFIITLPLIVQKQS